MACTSFIGACTPFILYGMNKGAVSFLSPIKLTISDKTKGCLLLTFGTAPFYIQMPTGDHFRNGVSKYSKFPSSTAFERRNKNHLTTNGTKNTK
jgi:hypothetical protein